jgi:hypothetical protein
MGNFPQAFSHLALINTAHNLVSANGAAYQRSQSRKTSPRAGDAVSADQT